MRAVAAGISEGRPLVPLVIVGDPACTKLVVLEGHVRLTTLILAADRLPRETPVVLGTSPSIRGWPLF